MANPLISRPVNTSKGFSSVTASSLVVQDDFPINKAIHTQEIITNDINFNSALSDGQITFTTTTTNNADVTADKGAFIHGTYDNTVQTGKSVSLLYFNAKNHGAATSQLYPIQMDLDTDNTDTGAGIAFNNNGKSDCIYMNVNGKSAGSASPSGIGMDLNRGDYNNSQFGLQIWDFSNTDRGIFGPSGIYLRKHGTATNSSHRLLRMYGRKYLQTFELDNISGSEKFMSAFYEPTGQNVLNFYTDGKIEAFGGVVDSTLTASKPVFTDANKKLSSSGTVPVANGGTGQSTLTSDSVLTGNGTSAITPETNLTFNGNQLVVANTATGTNQPLTVNDAGNAFQQIATRVRGSANGDGWRGRIVAGGDACCFLMGQFNTDDGSGRKMAWLGAHNDAMNAWNEFYINPDGGESLHLGYSGVNGGAPDPVLTIYNGTSGSSSSLEFRGQITGNSPSNAITPAAWQEVIHDGSTYFVPLYQ